MYVALSRSTKLEHINILNLTSNNGFSKNIEKSKFIENINIDTENNECVIQYL